MTDYYGILRGAIEETGAKTADARATIYLRAWAALEAQFDTPEVALPDDARKQQRQLMDEAISRIEREFGATREEASQAAAVLDQDADAGPDNTGDGGADAGDDIFAPSGGKMADQAIPDSAAAAPWRADAAGGTTGDAPQAKNRPLPGSLPPDTQRRGRGGLVAALVILLLIAAGTAGAWWRWDDVQTLMAQVTPAAEQTASEEPQKSDQVAVTRQDRADAPAMQESTQAPAAEEPRTMESAGRDTAAAPGQNDGASDQAPAATADNAQLAQNDAEAPKDQERVDDTGAVVERAYLILENERAGADDLRYAGQARWTVEGSGSEAVLTIDMQVPERSVALRVAMRENSDAALPASHTIDLIYQGPNGSPNLQDVAGIMSIRDSIETAEPLRAAGALVVPGQYLLALRGSQADRTENMDRLKSAKWLAVRALLDDGKHAVFLIENGEKGSAVLQEALNAWGDAQSGQTGSTQ